MNLFTWMYWQLLSYSIPSWMMMVAIAYCAARYGGGWFVPVGHLVVAALVSFLDILWIQGEMSKPGWNGTPDMDFVFQFGVLIRVLIINTALIPVTVVGLWRRRVAIASKEVPR